MIFGYFVNSAYCCFSTSLCSAQFNEPAAFITSCLLIIITTFPDTLFKTSPTLNGLNPGFLLRRINLHASKLSKDAQSLLFDIFVIHIFLTVHAIALRISDLAVPKHDETIILCHTSASSPDGPESPFVFIATFLLVLRQCRQTQLDAFFVLVLVVTPVGRCLLHQDVLTLIT